MKRLVVIILTLLILALVGLYFFDQYWIHRYDSLIAREASRYHVDPDLVWSIVYEETYFSPWKRGRNGEIGLMQVTPVVAREWAGGRIFFADQARAEHGDLRQGRQSSGYHGSLWDREAPLCAGGA